MSFVPSVAPYLLPHIVELTGLPSSSAQMLCAILPAFVLVWVFYACRNLFR